MFDVSTRTWIIQTITGYILLAIWALSTVPNPAIVLASEQQIVVFGLAVAALGVQNVSSFRAVGTANAAKS